MYSNDPKFLDRQIWTNSVDPDQIDQGLHCQSITCLPLCVHLVHGKISKTSSNFRIGSCYSARPGQIVPRGYSAGPGQIVPRGYSAGPGQIVPRGYSAGPGQIDQHFFGCPNFSEFCDIANLPLNQESSNSSASVISLFFACLS